MSRTVFDPKTEDRQIEHKQDPPHRIICKQRYADCIALTGTCEDKAARGIALKTSYIIICLAASAGLLAAVITVISGGSFVFLWCTSLVAACVVTIVLSSVHAVLVDFFQVIRSSTHGYDDESNDDVHAPDPGPVVAVRPPSAKQNSELRILAIDDDPLVLDLVKIIAQNASICHFTSASSAEAALAMLDDPNVTFHYLLIDIRMLDMDGIELCQRVRTLQRYRSTPITMLTAVHDIKHMSEAFRAGANDYITKPFDVADLEVRMRSAQKRHKSANKPHLATENLAAIKPQQLPPNNFEQASRPRRDRRNPLVSELVLSTYLSRLPEKALSGIGVFAVAIDRIEAIPATVLMRWRTELRVDLAAATALAFGSDLAVMAYTQDNDLLVVTHSVSQLVVVQIERDIERYLRSRWSDAGYGFAEKIVVSVGGPVQISGAKDDRKTYATDRALMLAEDRIAHKQRRSNLALRDV
jgi:DNA-binding response OmpR family regulator